MCWIFVLDFCVGERFGKCAEKCARTPNYYTTLSDSWERIPVVSYPWIFRTKTIRTQAQTFRTHFRSVRTQLSGRFVPNKLTHKMFKTNINIYFIYPIEIAKKLFSNHRNNEKLSDNF